MPRRAPSLVLACLLLALTQVSFAGTPKIISFDPPGTIWTLVTSINDSGTAVGYFEGTDEQDHGFIRSPSGQITVYDAPGALGTEIYDINDSGEMAGAYYTNKNTAFGFLLDQFGNLSTFELSSDRVSAESIDVTGLISGVYLGESENIAFTRDLSGDITIFAPPNAVSVQSAFIDAAGRIAGDYVDANVVAHAYVRDQSGNYTTFDAPDAGTDPGRGTFVTHLADKKIITVGYSTDNRVVAHGFIRSTAGNVTIFDVPGAGSSSGGTYPYSINLSGTVAGFYVDSSRVSHGFVRSPSGGIVTFDDQNAGGGSGQGTLAFTMNSSGQIGGSYYDPKGVLHGFLRLTQ
jgi:hypothetical protein